MDFIADSRGAAAAATQSSEEEKLAKKLGVSGSDAPANVAAFAQVRCIVKYLFDIDLANLLAFITCHT